jgi:hypothetical protein
MRLVATRAVARVRESRYRPRVGERRAREGRRATALAPGESERYRLALARGGAPARARGGRDGGESEARHWWGESAGESDVARSDWSTCRDLIGPCVLALQLAVFDRLESKKFEKNCKKSQISSPIPLYISLPGWSSFHTPFHLISLFQTRLFYSSSRHVFLEHKLK